MSYFLADSTGPLTDFASIGGLSDFTLWAKDQDPPLSAFAARGWTEDLVELSATLSDTDVPEALEGQVEALYDALQVAKDVLIVSDGMSQEDLTTLASNDNLPIHKVADANLNRMMVSVQYAFARGRSAAKGTKPDVEHVVSVVRKALLQVLPETLMEVLVQGAGSAISHLPKRRHAEMRSAAGPIKIHFDNENPEAVKWVKEHALKLAKGLSDTTREDLKASLARAFDEGDLKGFREDVLDAVGNDARAEKIARTEVMRASNEGQRQGWAQAIDKGLLDEDTKRIWIATFKCCDECDVLDGQKTTLDGEYPDPGGDGPPLHPNCRCTEGISA